ncbi:IclR family transcriptional regulator [Aquabacter sp. P-9]|uniref:IclR family transcriptional regulator n=1 Tax=Aquabacter sediminis TaxID=3029197 RepID=UPI00237DF43E|nr:IclR family transcriptional regulator [Aquabacter sp. P-9]MDE1567026.1 IclR family transcriptional regulator [Aquabacter sp. P-9]
MFHYSKRNITRKRQYEDGNVPPRSTTRAPRDATSAPSVTSLGATSGEERASGSGSVASSATGTSTLDLALRMVEFLAMQSRPLALAQIAAHFSASKATVYRHLVTLQRHGFVRQDPETGRYDAGVKLMVLGEALRARFDVLSAARAELMELRDRTGQAVTICALIDGEVVVLELVQGRTLIEFATRPGTRLDFHASAHGKVWLAFGDDHLLTQVLSTPLKNWTPHTLTDPDALRSEVIRVRQRGWSTAPDEVLTGVNTLAAPIFDHRGTLVGSLAIVGATQFIPPDPPDTQVAEVTGTAARISRSLGWRS